MKAIRYHAYGPPEVLRLQEVDPPAVGDDEVLIRVRAASVNPLDWHFMRGAPYLARLAWGLTRPRGTSLGADLAGHVEAVGRDVTEFKRGDEVFGSRGLSTAERAAAFAEYATLPASGALLKKPANLTFEQAAAVPVAALTALQALRGRVRPGQKVLVNGAAGGTGTFTVQLAKTMGAEVTGVCSTPNVGLVLSIGADHVVDYTKEDFTHSGKRYDLLVDLVGNRRPGECRRVLAPRGVLVGAAPSKGQWIGPVIGMLRVILLSRMVSQTMLTFLAQISKDDLTELRELLEAGKITPIIDRTYPLTELPEAVAYLETGRARGKVVITM
ncbi:NADPH:quinone reductase [Acrocarpospora pleiomorpha]|uniref:NADPH:quinone reductase n=1 Tax=Acrocarpospora pleiomorpha TaxID=90975 RepID=A0A5M3Y0U6_9ACTN|nr:NAD(P)-dependent alcohol dehydrogenase [Acrocarpospora pleiomorpha]GES24328.1 NADPH:quinone reductase [Acrocarpospora pleiomorpha]